MNTSESPIVHGNATVEIPFDYEAVKTEMEDLWPQLFAMRTVLLLKVGIAKELHEEAAARGSTLSKRKIRLFLERWCNQPEYLLKIAAGEHRHDINGLPIEMDLLPHHVKSAKRRIESLKKKAKNAAQPQQPGTGNETTITGTLGAQPR